MKKLSIIKGALLLLLCIGPLSGLFAQSLSLESNTLAGTKNQLPFWLWANQLGQFDKNSSTIQNFSINAFHGQQIGGSDFSYQVGLDLDLLLADENDIRFTQLFGSMSWRFLQLQIGAFPEEEVYAGLSTTNGNLSASRNARPHPKIRAGFNRYVPVFTDWFFINGFYEEGLLNDDRYVKDTHLHRGNLFFRFGQPKSLQVTVGIEHFVMWGGTHPVLGEFPGWEDYFNYLTASAGGNNVIDKEQLNAMGNSYGVYQIEFSKAWDKLNATLYISHPYEDHSGMEFVNYSDNLIGLHLAFHKQQAHLKNIVFEYFHTKNQSGAYLIGEAPDENGRGRGIDDYFNHGLYLSGATYNKMAMVSPLFAPVLIADGTSRGFENTRFAGFHLGADGLLSETFAWKALLTYSNNIGRHNGQGGTTISPSRKQLSALGQVSWQPLSKKISISTSVAADRGSVYDNGVNTTRLGAMISFNYYFPN
ncbi:Capsule assembly protein Wzi [Draconibacterium orientale]|uniref:Capsule assembly protein Wzi n=1 Tax=Draconibacterium orientale TaxID=1168034 RepID=A0A1I0I5J2_9BACT|nr:capsule assembly Wzi family protein [Draconibacterium orientale]SET91046.1 Capsule assembly protein Wzi [Draconibacterium orientale]